MVMIVVVTNTRPRPLQFLPQSLVERITFPQDDELGGAFSHTYLYPLSRPDGSSQRTVSPKFGIEFIIAQGPDIDAGTGGQNDRAAGEAERTDGSNSDRLHTRMDDGTVGGSSIAGGAGGSGD